MSTILPAFLTNMWTGGSNPPPPLRRSARLAAGDIHTFTSTSTPLRRSARLAAGSRTPKTTTNTHKKTTAPTHTNSSSTTSTSTSTPTFTTTTTTTSTSTHTYGTRRKATAGVFKPPSSFCYKAFEKRVTVAQLRREPELLLQYMEEDGIVIVSGVYTKEELEELWKGAVDHLGARGVHVNKSSTYHLYNTNSLDFNMSPDISGMMVQDKAVQASSFVQKAKSHPTVKWLFSLIWSCPEEELVMQAGGAMIGLSPESDRGRQTPKTRDLTNGYHAPKQQWMHTDSGRVPETRHKYQSTLWLEGAELYDYGFTFMSGSKDLHDQFLAAHPQCELEEDGDLMHIQFVDRELKWLEERGCEMMKAVVEPGSLMLWDSRLIHATDKPCRDRPHPKHRFLVYGGYERKAVAAAAAAAAPAAAAATTAAAAPAAGTKGTKGKRGRTEVFTSDNTTSNNKKARTSTPSSTTSTTTNKPQATAKSSPSSSTNNKKRHRGTEEVEKSAGTANNKKARTSAPSTGTSTTKWTQSAAKSTPHSSTNNKGKPQPKKKSPPRSSSTKPKRQSPAKKTAPRTNTNKPAATLTPSSSTSTSTRKRKTSETPASTTKTARMKTD